jgi:hypothetical protein
MRVFIFSAVRAEGGNSLATSATTEAEDECEAIAGESLDFVMREGVKAEWRLGDEWRVEAAAGG